MPELPEVETTRRAIAPFIEGKTITEVLVRNAGLRWPVQPELEMFLPGQRIMSVDRRGKYLLVRCGSGTLILHLGMSGRLSVVPAATPAGKHDHLDILLENSIALRFNDPRRFGTALWTDGDPLQHPLLVKLGPEPLEEGFDDDYLFTKSRNRTVAVKQFIMDSHTVVGVGNIYANEALYRAGMRPERPAGKLSETDCRRLVITIREVLRAAIAEGGTTIRDFRVGEEQTGYFAVQLKVYGRAGAPCPTCGTPIVMHRQGGRSTYFCSRCQN
ncbi:bifunctional DNA-formamidopyrimidine glycosylase/DNA-(apurinic or apyrimidinic site) lyase [Geomobilimonas luticola]|uniref:Formamidopyrimidine-DNA glycosylase n=1 Tax=Geomobilimonas luticola TaxID=1114878 RepID=A0ABS5SAF5_9BACT|nr:bifunctional DNA-formamidopyrimidine glycosylase/DNA-(apurinic or apyrimidinic site) lyase [Geomobilimonas luticola]MBT0652359.1 bifunctional DNA-formamidopyrimidine glycosylase/DNA-(apurinic or apyrimidinic site) lyase [Geomobilimonas luticola]